MSARPPWAITGLQIPAPLAAYMNFFAGALTPCALFAIGLGLSAEGLRTNLNASIALAAIKLVITPLIVYGLCLVTNLNPLYTIAAVICAAVPTAKTVFILAGAYKVEEELVASSFSETRIKWANRRPLLPLIPPKVTTGSRTRGPVNLIVEKVSFCRSGRRILEITEGTLNLLYDK